MSRLIDADALKDKVITWDRGDIEHKIDEMPTIEAEPVRRGRWLECEDGWGDTHYQCSECGAEWNLDAGTPSENQMHYCPNCGARMEVEG